MALVFRTAGAWGAGKGANLTATEVDTNFYELQQQIDDIIADPVQPNQIVNFTVSGTTFTVHLANGATYGPLPLPVLAWHWEEEWLPSTAYKALDIFTVSESGLYMVLRDHTSALTFDPLAVDDGLDKATGVLSITSSNNALNNETVTIDGKVYTFKTVLTNTNGFVLIGADKAASLANLSAAINLGAGSGTLYAAVTTLHATVTGDGASPLTVTAKVGGTAANSIVTTETLTNGVWNHGTLQGGASGTPRPLYKKIIGAVDEVTYDLAFCYPDLVVPSPAPGERVLLFQFVATRQLLMSTGLPGSRAFLAAPATENAVVLAIEKKGVPIGTITFTPGTGLLSPSGQEGTFAFAADVTLNIGDWIQVFAPLTTDATAARLSATIVVSRT